MKFRSRLSMLAAVLLGCFGISFLNGQSAEKPDQEAIEKAILDTYAEITKAVESADWEAVFGYVLENDKGCLINDGKLTLTRQEALDYYRNNSRNGGRIVYTMDKKYVTVLSPDTAVLATEGRYEAATADGRTFGLPMAQTVVFVLKDNRWKVLHSHTSLPANP